MLRKYLISIVCLVVTLTSCSKNIITDQNSSSKHSKEIVESDSTPQSSYNTYESNITSNSINDSLPQYTKDNYKDTINSEVQRQGYYISFLQENMLRNNLKLKNGFFDKSLFDTEKENYIYEQELLKEKYSKSIQEYLQSIDGQEILKQYESEPYIFIKETENNIAIVTMLDSENTPSREEDQIALILIWEDSYGNRVIQDFGMGFGTGMGVVDYIRNYDGATLFLSGYDFHPYRGFFCRTFYVLKKEDESYKNISSSIKIKKDVDLSQWHCSSNEKIISVLVPYENSDKIYTKTMSIIPYENESLLITQDESVKLEYSNGNILIKGNV